ncbi:PucR family transcriptional regulator [Streptomyces filamentosus]|uniref:PucR family transcriptional regulator n=1 Tax=Streptomyces filamentosus TaxID=67294 RepID=A0A919BCN2_STRFL|nr:helix-turn-helix domain-containing protein [Streptomyces filamentosus]GHF79718.1 hypothetical protein GCM10017667_04010 [Streptomyces filamentosus]
MPAALDRAPDTGAPTGELLDRALAPLGAPACHLLTGSGRTVARTAAARAELPAPRAADLLRTGRGTTLRVDDGAATDFDAWHLYLPEPVRVPARALAEVAALLARHRREREPEQVAERATAELADALRAFDAFTGEQADRVAAFGSCAEEHDGSAGEFGMTGEGDGSTRLRAALAACGLGETGPYTVVVASLAPRGEAGDAAAALAEALRHLPSAARAVTEDPDGGATAVVAREPDAGYDVRARLGEVWPLIHGCRPEAAPHAGVSGPVDAPERLPAGLAQARYALAAARATGPAGPRVVGLGDLDGLDMLLAGVPSDVREVYRDTVLGPLLKAGRGSAPMLLETLESFLAHDRSWARTAEALHVHVNTVHYRVSRIEELTGRDLSRLDHAADLRAALLCR